MNPVAPLDGTQRTDRGTGWRRRPEPARPAGSMPAPQHRTRDDARAAQPRRPDLIESSRTRPDWTRRVRPQCAAVTGPAVAGHVQRPDSGHTSHGGACLPVQTCTRTGPRRRVAEAVAARCMGPSTPAAQATPAARPPGHIGGCLTVRVGPRAYRRRMRSGRKGTSVACAAPHARGTPHRHPRCWRQSAGGSAPASDGSVKKKPATSAGFSGSVHAAHGVARRLTGRA